jgi:hypothetical protein
MKSSRKQDPKTGKGLKHFSMKVCEKVKSKGTTTYNEVADELVAEFSNDPTISRQSFEGSLSMGGDSEPFDQKNIRRRVYDALNVLMAINVISKEKKEIKWIGLPTNAAQECLNLEEDKRKLIEMIDEKRKQVRTLLTQQIAYKKLVERNKASQQTLSPNAIIKLPFIIITTDMKTTIDCGISNDRSEYFFTLNNAFGLHDDVEVLKRIGMVGEHPQDLAEAKEILPKALHSEIDLWSIE